MAEEKKIIRLADIGQLEKELRQDLAEEEAKGKAADVLYCESISDTLSDLSNLPTIDPASCLNWHIGKPPEHKSIFAKFKGTKKWPPGMFETVSNEVLVTIEFPDKTRIVTVSNTTDGQWTGCCKNFECEVVAWTEKPAPAPKGVFV